MTPDEMAAVLRLVSEGRLTADEAAPIVAALEEKARLESRPAATARGRGGASPSAGTSAHELLSGRLLRVVIVEDGRTVVNLQIPLVAAGLAIDQMPGLSSDHRSRIAEAIRSGLTGPILEVADGGDQVRIVIE